MKKAPKKFSPQRFTLRKGYTRAEAFEVAKKRATRDFRGFSYDPKTGKAVLI